MELPIVLNLVLIGQGVFGRLNRKCLSSPTDGLHIDCLLTVPQSVTALECEEDARVIAQNVTYGRVQTASHKLESVSCYFASDTFISGDANWSETPAARTSVHMLTARGRMTINWTVELEYTVARCFKVKRSLRDHPDVLCSSFQRCKPDFNHRE